MKAFYGIVLVAAITSGVVFLGTAKPQIRATEIEKQDITVTDDGSRTITVKPDGSFSFKNPKAASKYSYPDAILSISGTPQDTSFAPAALWPWRVTL